MNCSEENRISLVGYLASQGIKPTAYKNGHAWYCSPFRQETKPSFKVNRNINQWYDFATGENGGLLDLVCKMQNCSVTGALMHLQRPEIRTRDFLFFGQPKEEVNESQIVIEGIQKLSKAPLIYYLKERGISLNAAMSLKEVHYSISNTDKKFFAIGFKNDRGGWELRNKFWKGSSSPKHYTTIPGQKSSLNIFEGFFDYLSCLQYYKRSGLKNDTIVLNGLTNLNKIVDTLKRYDYINLFLDTDPAGKSAADKIKAIHPKVTDFSFIYEGFKDFNEFLTANNTKNGK